nr:tRNA 2-thiocytidine biosynthesis protein TtcA [Treponema sp.]
MGQALLYSLIDKAIFDYKLINDNDNILIGASAGKDSTALIEYFAFRKKRKNANFNFTALHIASEFGEAFPEEIKKLMEDWGVNLVTVNVNVQERLKEGRKMSCYWCSTQRRKELLDYALANGF